MSVLFKHRLGRHLFKMTRYLKYVFNDFFVIALIFLVGGLGLEYSNFLKHLHHGSLLLSFIIVLIFWVTMQLGRLATLVQPADHVFLLPRGRSLRSYFNLAYLYSWINANVIQVVVWIILLPVLSVDLSASRPVLFVDLVILILVKTAWLASDLNGAYQRNPLAKRLLNHGFFPGVGLLLMVFFSWQLALGLVLLWNLFLICARSKAGPQINWRGLIKLEGHRMHTIDWLFNLFVDVPGVQSSVKRRRYLMPLFNLVSPKPSHTYLYLYLRGLLRDQEFSGLYLRLTVIGALLLLGVSGSWLPIIMGLVFVYLIAFQLVPFYTHFDNNAFVHIYPLTLRNRLISFRRVISILLTTTVILFAFAFAFSSDPVEVDVIGIVLQILEVVVLIKHLPKSVRKLENRK